MAPTVEMFAGGLAEVLVLDVTYHSGLDHKSTDRATPRLLVTFVHAIQTSFGSVWDWLWNPGSDKECSKISSNLVGHKGRSRENFFEVSQWAWSCRPACPVPRGWPAYPCPGGCGCRAPSHLLSRGLHYPGDSQYSECVARNRMCPGKRTHDLCRLASCNVDRILMDSP